MVVVFEDNRGRFADGLQSCESAARRRVDGYMLSVSSAPYRDTPQNSTDGLA